VFKKRKKLFTFVGVDQAKQGYTFLYEGMAKKCENCSYRNVCHGNLTPKKIYRVLELRDKTVNCNVYVGKARLVGVYEAEIEAVVEPRHAFPMAVIRYKPQICSIYTCKYFEKCFPVGLSEGMSFKILETRESFQCPTSGKRLVEVLLLPSS
jgi:uncharacterized protein (UPF0179 family)